MTNSLSFHLPENVLISLCLVKGVLAACRNLYDLRFKDVTRCHMACVASDERSEMSFIVVSLDIKQLSPHSGCS